MRLCTRVRTSPLLVLAQRALAAGAVFVAVAPGAAAQAPPPDLLHSPSFRLLATEPMVTGDVNGDGHVDLIYSRSAVPAVLAVSLGDGLGGFTQEVLSDIVPPDPVELFAGEFDGDGRTDVAFKLNLTPNVQVVHGASDGSLVDPVVLPLSQPGKTARDLTLCDANDDGHLDLVASQQDTNRFTLYLGTGDGGFVSPPSQILAAQNPGFLDHGDFDGDGHVDLISAFGGVNPEPSVLWGHGDGSFDSPALVAGLKYLGIGDLNGDGWTDIIADSHEDGLEGYWSWQNGRFVRTLIEIELPLTKMLAVGDLDRDGINELLQADTSGRLDVLAPREDGTFQVDARYGLGDEPNSLHVVDVDEDGGLDVIAGEQYSATILSGNGDGTLQPDYRFEQEPADLAVAELTGDGLPDVVAVFGAGHPALLLRGLLGGGLELPESLDAGPAPEQVWLVDATGDGQLDVLTAGGTAVAVAAGHGNGSFDLPLISAQPEEIVEAELASFFGDGLLDLAVHRESPPSSNQNYLHFLTNAGGMFTETASTQVTPPGGEIADFELADVDGDLDIDLLVHWSAGYLRVFINQPTGFEPALLTPFSGTSFVVQDIDADGDVDIANRLFDVELRLGDGTGGFADPFELTVSSNVRSILVDDLDRDGLPDLILSGHGNWFFQNDISVARGLGGGSFGPFGAWSTGANANFARLADMNGDGATDLVVALEDAQLLIVENGLGPWDKRGHSLAGAAGWSRLQGFGPLTPASSVTLRVSNGLPGAFAILIAGPTEILAPFKGGVLVPQPTLIIPLAPLNAEGTLQLSGAWPATMPSGAGFSMQIWRAEPGAPSGFAATTAIRGTAP